MSTDSANTMQQRKTLQTSPLPPFYFAHAYVCSTQRLSPTFLRVTFAGDELQHFGNPDRTLDQRIKLVFPTDSQRPNVDQQTTFNQWKELPDAERGSMRTYSIRGLDIAADGSTTVTVDFAMHPGDDDIGPGTQWARAVQVGDEMVLYGPRRGRFDGGGIEYHPQDAETVILVGDETATPAVSRILEETSLSGRNVTAFLEVPSSQDILDIEVGDGQTVHWLTRDDQQVGSAAIPAVLEHLDLGASQCDEACSPETTDESAPWETPWYSNLDALSSAKAGLPRSCYFWIAGESGLVTSLRRHLVKDLGAGRDAVAFMGYWRRGVAMRS